MVCVITVNLCGQVEFHVICWEVKSFAFSCNEAILFPLLYAAFICEHFVVLLENLSVVFMGASYVASILFVTLS